MVVNVTKNHIPKVEDLTWNTTYSFAFRQLFGIFLNKYTILTLRKHFSIAKDSSLAAHDKKLRQKYKYTMTTFALLCVPLAFTCSSTGKDLLHENNIHVSSKRQVMSLENVNQIYGGDVKTLMAVEHSFQLSSINQTERIKL